MKKCLALLSTLLLMGCIGNDEERDYSLDYITTTIDDKIMFIDMSTGKKVKGAKEYDDATYFFDDITRVQKNGEYWYLDTHFEPINKEKYVDATIFHEGLAWTVKKGGHIVAVKKNGEKAFEFAEAEEVYCFEDGIAIFYDAEKKLGIVDTDGKVLMKPDTYTDFNYYKFGYIPVAKETKDGKKWGVINYKGEEVLPCKYANIKTTDKKGLFRVTVKEKDSWRESEGIIDAEGKEIIPATYNSLRAEKNGTYIFSDTYNGKYRCGLLDSEGEEIIEGKYIAISSYGNGLYPVMNTENEVGFINEDGKEVIEPKFKYADRFNDDGYAIAYSMNTERCGIINKKGEYEVKAKYEELFDLGEDYYLAKKKENRIEYFGVINHKGEEVVKFSEINKVNLPYALNLRKVEDQYVDAPRIAKALYENIEELESTHLEANQLARKFNVSLKDYGSKILKNVNKHHIDMELTALVDYDYDYNTFERRYFISKFIFSFTPKSEKITKNFDQIFNLFAEKLGSPTHMDANQDLTDDITPFNMPAFPNSTCKLTKHILVISPNEKIYLDDLDDSYGYGAADSVAVLDDPYVIDSVATY